MSRLYLTYKSEALLKYTFTLQQHIISVNLAFEIFPMVLSVTPSRQSYDISFELDDELKKVISQTKSNLIKLNPTKPYQIQLFLLE